MKKNGNNILDTYLLKIICSEKCEPEIRKIIKTNINDKTLLNSIEGVDIDDSKVKIEATIKVNNFSDNNLDKILNKISIHPSVISFGLLKKNNEFEIDDEEL